MKKSNLTLLTASVVYVEWIEYALYMYLGTRISHYFFPDDFGAYALLLTYGIFAISYLSRPIGGLLFGLYADRKGRRKPLIYSSLLVGIATLSIGLIPSYAVIGIASPLLLLLCRLLQSIAVSGEFNNASIFLMEHQQRGQTLAGSWVGTASSAGMFTGALIAYFISHIDHSFAWRIAFIGVGILALLMMLLRRYLVETPEFTQYHQRINTEKSWFSHLRAQGEGLLNIAIIGAFLSVYIYTCSVFFVGYMIKELHYAPSSATLLMMVVQGGVTVLIPLFGWLGDKIDYRTLLKGAIPLIAAMALWLFYGASIASHSMIIGALGLYTLANAIISAVIFRYMFDCLPLEIRCTGSSFIYSLAAALFGGTAPVLATYLIEQHNPMAPAYYVCFFSLLALLSVHGTLGRWLFASKQNRLHVTQANNPHDVSPITYAGKNHGSG